MWEGYSKELEGYQSLMKTMEGRTTELEGKIRELAGDNDLVYCMLLQMQTFTKPGKSMAGYLRRKKLCCWRG